MTVVYSFGSDKKHWLTFDQLEAKKKQDEDDRKVNEAQKKQERKRTRSERQQERKRKQKAQEGLRKQIEERRQSISNSQRQIADLQHAVAEQQSTAEMEFQNVLQIERKLYDADRTLQRMISERDAEEAEFRRSKRQYDAAETEAKLAVYSARNWKMSHQGLLDIGTSKSPPLIIQNTVLVVAYLLYGKQADDWQSWKDYQWMMCSKDFVDRLDHAALKYLSIDSASAENEQFNFKYLPTKFLSDKDFAFERVHEDTDSNSAAPLVLLVSSLVKLCTVRKTRETLKAKEGELNKKHERVVRLQRKIDNLKSSKRAHRDICFLRFEEIGVKKNEMALLEETKEARRNSMLVMKQKHLSVPQLARRQKIKSQKHQPDVKIESLEEPVSMVARAFYNV